MVDLITIFMHVPKCMCMCTLCVCVRVCDRVCVCVCMYVHVYVCVYVHVYVHMLVRKCMVMERGLLITVNLNRKYYHAINIHKRFTLTSKDGNRTTNRKRHTWGKRRRGLHGINIVLAWY